MPGIEFLKDWDPKKHGWPALLVAVLFMGYEILAPKDRSCENQVNYLQKQNTTLVNNQIRLANELLEQKQQNIQKDTIIKNYQLRDSAMIEKVIKPAKAIVKESKK